MKTFALTLFAAVLGMTQPQLSLAQTAAPTAQAPPTRKAAPPATNAAPPVREGPATAAPTAQAPPTRKAAAPGAKAAPATKAAPAAKAAPKIPAKGSTAAKKPAPKPAAATQAQTIPAGAVLVEPFTYRYTDSNGKVWMYRQSPFGISKWEESASPAPQQPAAKSEPVVVTDLGDSVRFERKTPFGGGSWVRKKTELTAEEKAWVSGQQEQSNPTPAKSDNKVAGNQ